MTASDSSDMSCYMRTTWMLSASESLEVGDSSRVRLFSEEEGHILAENVSKRDVYARHSYENDFYAQRIRALAGHTIIEVFRPGNPDDMVEEAAQFAALLEKVAILSTTLAMTKDVLQRHLGISSMPGAEIDFTTSSELRFLRSRSKPAPLVKGIRIDPRFVRRYWRCGFDTLVSSHDLNSDLFRRVLASLNWLFESRLEPRLPAAVVKSSVALETLLIFSESESLARSLSERTAFILSSDPSMRRDISRIIKRFYEVRSGVVHGNAKKTKKLTPSLCEAVDRLAVLLYLCIGANSALWPSKVALGEWCEDQRWGKPSTEVRVPFSRNYLKKAIEMGRKAP